MSTTSDVVVIGSGHNALITSAYLARSGMSVTVLEERETPGGGTMSEELTLPGFRHDSAATGHIALQFNPVLAADELGLSRHGLRYVAPDPVLVLSDADGGEALTMWRDAERTAKEIARFSESDAEAYLAFLADWHEVAPLHLRRMAGAPGTVADTSAEAAAKWADLASPSAWQHIEARFGHPRTRALVAWLAGISTQPIARPGTGMLAFAMTGMLGSISWPNAIGGSGALPRALIAVIESEGGRVLCGHRVESILVEDHRAVGVRTASGEVFHARRAVVSGAHAATLPQLVHPETLPPEFDSLREWRAGASMFVIHLAVPRIPAYRTVSGTQQAVIGAFGTPEGIIGQADDVGEGRLSDNTRWMMAACSSVVDPHRAPDGQATLKLLTAAPYAVDGDPANWAKVKDDYAQSLLGVFARSVDGFDVGDELAMVVHTPVDLEARNRHNIRGGHQGGEMTPNQMGPNRPVAGWSGYRMPVAGLYQTGSSTHPGGAVTGFAGRNAARVVLDDLGIPSGHVMVGADDVRPVPNGTFLR